MLAAKLAGVRRVTEATPAAVVAVALLPRLVEKYTLVPSGTGLPFEVTVAYTVTDVPHSTGFADSETTIAVGAGRGGARRSRRTRGSGRTGRGGSGGTGRRGGARRSRRTRGSGGTGRGFSVGYGEDDTRHCRAGGTPRCEDENYTEDPRG